MKPGTNARYPESKSDTIVCQQVVGVSTRNLHSCPQEVKEAAYKGLVRPALEYGSSVWDPPGVVLQEEL